MKFFSKAWKGSKQPRKQHKYRYHAPLHLRQKLVSAHLAKALAKEYRKRSMAVRKGDEVTIMRGSFSGKNGKVTDVDLKKLKIFVDAAKKKKVSGQEIQIAIDPSNVMITKLNLEDKKRKAIIERKAEVKKVS